MSLWMHSKWMDEDHASEVVRTLLEFGFDDLKFNRVCACHATTSTILGGALEAAGMKHEGVLRQQDRRGGAVRNLVLLAAARSNWLASLAPNAD